MNGATSPEGAGDPIPSRDSAGRATPAVSALSGDAFNDLPEGWLTDVEVDELRRLARGRVVLELGAWKGRSTVVLAEVATFVVSIDHHRGMPAEYGIEGTSLEDYLANVRPLENVAPVLDDFGFATLFKPQAFGLVFLDGIHDFDSVTHDLELVARFDCPLALHDWWAYDVRPAAEALGLEPTRVVGSVAVFE